MNILAVDDELRGINLLARSIQKAVPDAVLSGFQNPCDALIYAETHPIDVAFLDVRMPELSGLELALALKEHYPRINIIFVTGYREYSGEAFALHASGYVHKPVSPAAVREQMENLRFMPAAASPDLVQELGPYRFDHVAQRVYLGGRDTLLNRKEFALFHLLARQVGFFLSAEELFRQVWGDDPNGHVHTVYVRVSSLRKKLEMDEFSPYTIEHKRGSGYRLTRPSLP